MAEDERFNSANGEAIRWLRTKKQSWSMKRLAESANVSLDTVKRAEKGEALQLRSLHRIAMALGVEPREVSGDDGHPRRVFADHVQYTWDTITEAAKSVGDKIFDDECAPADVRVLAFPGPSLTFLGLVLASLPPEVAIRVPVYTCIFVDEAGSEPEGFHPVVTEPDNPRAAFKLLVPAAVTTGLPEGKWKIVALDDTIISGITMRALRTYFRRRGYAEQFKIACGICYEGRTVESEMAPEIIGIESPSPKFHLPWGDGFCFEAKMKAAGDTRLVPPEVQDTFR